MSDEKITKLPISFKTPHDPNLAQQLQVERFGADGRCNHMWAHRVDGGPLLGGSIVHAHYLIRDGETEVECGLCGIRLDPMWVLQRLAGDETQWRSTLARYQDEMHRLQERRQTRCEHCRQMTRISHSDPRKTKSRPDPGPERPQPPNGAA